MGKVYLEYNQEEISAIDFSSLSDEDEEFSFDNNEEDESQEYEEKEGIFFVPYCLYRNPVPEAYELDIDFDIKDCERLHLTVVRYNQGDVFGKWHVVGISKTRREALELGYKIENGEYEKEKPWEEEGDLETVDVFSLFLEN